MIIESDSDSHPGDLGGFAIEEYYEEEEDYDGGHKQKRGKKGRKKGKGKKKIFKKMKPFIIGLAGLKLVLSHLLLKKFALLSILSFLLSKVSFILATLVALKQFFHAPTQHRSTDSNKLEVVHIPIRKLRRNKHKEKDYESYDESRFIPVTYAPETVYDTTPFFSDFPRGQQTTETFTSSEEDLSAKFEDDFNGKFKENSNGKYSEDFGEEFDGNVGETYDGKDLASYDDKEFGQKKFKESDNSIYNEHFKNKFAFERSDVDVYDEKNYYKNHVHSPFV